MRARSVCGANGCSAPAVARGRCAQHRRRVNGARWAKLVQLVVARDRGVCWLCGGSGATSADHVVRARDGGRDVLTNLRAAHEHCNKSRG